MGADAFGKPRFRCMHESGCNCAEYVSTYLWKLPLHGSLLGTSTISTKLVEWPVVESKPARVVVL